MNFSVFFFFFIEIFVGILIIIYLISVYVLTALSLQFVAGGDSLLAQPLEHADKFPATFQAEEMMIVLSLCYRPF